MGVSKQFLTNQLFKSPSNSKGRHLVGSSLEVVMVKFSIIASPNNCNFISGSKCFAHSKTCTIDSIMMLKDHWVSSMSMTTNLWAIQRYNICAQNVSLFYRKWCESC